VRFHGRPKTSNMDLGRSLAPRSDPLLLVAKRK
jgi:hypothetical protein